MTRIIDGRAIAKAIRGQVERDVASLAGRDVPPRLAVVVATDDEGARWYVNSLGKQADRLGIDHQLHDLGAGAAPEAVTERLGQLAGDPAVHAILCQTPLPPGLDLAMAGEHIPVGKDVDGANPRSLGLLTAGSPGAFAPATAQAVMEILDHEQVGLDGADAVVVGRSSIVGKPAALLLLARHATVTICHSHTADLPGECRRADVLVAAAGSPGLIGARHIRPGATVIDVGTTAGPDGKMIGDVDADGAEGVAAGLTPVPGGVGPVTTAVLLRNVVTAAGAPASDRS